MPNKPDVDAVVWGRARGFHGEVAAAAGRGQLRQDALGAGNAVGGLVVGRALCQAKLDHGVRARSLVIVSGVGESVVKVLDTRFYLGVGDVFQTVVVDDVYDHRQGDHFGRLPRAHRIGIFQVFLLKSRVFGSVGGIVQGLLVQDVGSAGFLGSE